ncbi:MAG: Asp23/Gls24 family envelope stress response protein [Clostridia bacterium]|nr:Asp23/Gls24 family envelope stress response protein [Clostridia bacterium]
MPRELETPAGRIILTEEIVAAIAGAAASGCYGVASMAPRRLQDEIAGMLGREAPQRGVEVWFREDGSVALRVDIVVVYGTRVSEVARNVRERVRYAVEQATGCPVARVDIHVRGVRVPPGEG